IPGCARIAVINRSRSSTILHQSIERGDAFERTPCLIQESRVTVTRQDLCINADGLGAVRMDDLTSPTAGPPLLAPFVRPERLTKEMLLARQQSDEQSFKVPATFGDQPIGFAAKNLADRRL